MTRWLLFSVLALIYLICNATPVLAQSTASSLAYPPCVEACIEGNLNSTEPSCRNNSVDCRCQNSTLVYSITGCVAYTCSRENLGFFIYDQRQTCENVFVQSNGHSIMVYQYVFVALSCTAVILRFLSRAVMRKMWWDDGIILFVMFLGIASTIVQAYATTLGLGRHWWKVQYEDQIILGKLFYAIQLIYVAFQVMVKLPMLMLYLRIFAPGRTRLATKVMIVYMVVHGLAFILLLAFRCLPVAAIWDTSIPGKCIDLNSLSFAGAACSITEDIVIFSLPLRQILRMSMSKREKSYAILLMMMGIYATVCSIVRLAHIWIVTANSDPSYDTYELIKWSIIENDMALICASLMAIRPLLRRIGQMLNLEAQNDSGVVGSDSNVAGLNSPSTCTTAHSSDLSTSLTKSSGWGYVEKSPVHWTNQIHII